jgi:GAF domain-containing protein
MALDELERLGMFAGQASIAIENAPLRQAGNPR